MSENPSTIVTEFKSPMSLLGGLGGVRGKAQFTLKSLVKFPLEVLFYPCVKEIFLPHCILLTFFGF